jgi:hypothetical protein
MANEVSVLHIQLSGECTILMVPGTLSEGKDSKGLAA